MNPDLNHLYDTISIESGAMRVAEGGSWPILKFSFTSSGNSNPTTVHFVGTPEMMNSLKRLVQDSVRLAISHSFAPEQN